MGKHGKMVAVHTSQVDIYHRMWCVREIGEALNEMIPVTAAFSDRCRKIFKGRFKASLRDDLSLDDALGFCGVPVNTKRAKCSREEDKETNTAKVNELGGFEKIDKEVTGFRRKVLHGDILEVLQAVAMEAKPQGVFDLAGEGHLEAVDMFYEVADNGDEQARNALCDALEQWLPSRSSREELFKAFYALELADRTPSLELILNLLDTMAQLHHDRSFEIFAQVHVDTDRITHNCKHETRKDLWAAYTLQSLAKRGDQRAMDRLKLMAEQGDEQQQKAGRNALASLAKQWNRQALKVLRDMTNAKITWPYDKFYHQQPEEVLRSLEALKGFFSNR